MTTKQINEQEMLRELRKAKIMAVPKWEHFIDGEHSRQDFRFEGEPEEVAKAQALKRKFERSVE